MNVTLLSAQTVDSTMVSTTIATDSAANNESILLNKSSASPLISTAVDTTALFADYIIKKPEVDKSAMYKSATYYFMLFFLVYLYTLNN